MHVHCPDGGSWHDPLPVAAPALLPVVLSLVCQTMRRPFPGVAGAADLRLGGEGLAADSIDVVEAATAVSEMFRMGQLGVDDYLLRDTRIGAWAELASHALSLSGGQLCFRSSGSTGRPSSNIHPLGLLREEASFFARRLDGRRVLVASPPHHIYGFIWGPLLSEAMGVECIFMPHSMACGWSQATLGRDDIVVGFPLFWSWFARTRGTLETRLTGISSTAPLPGELAVDLVGMGAQPLLEIFGTSETAGLGWRDDPGRAFRLLPHWRCATDRSTLERCMADGRWQPGVQVPDQLQWGRDGRTFTPLGRIDGALQVAGTNVFPAAIAKRMRSEVPGIADAVLRPGSDDAAHVRLKAFVVPQTGQADLARLERRLHEWARVHLRPAERPVSVTFGEHVPRNAMGKLTDW